MGIIKSQSIKSTIITFFGFTIGAINMIFVMPRFFTKEQYGLIQVFISFAIQAVTVGSFGMVVVTNKFLPYYKAHLKPQNRDLLTIALVLGSVGMLSVLGMIFLNQDLIVRKFSRNSPLFVEYMYLFPLFALGYFYSYILESFNNNYKFTVWSSFVREIFYRFFNLFAAIIFAFGWLSFASVVNLYMAMYWIGALILGINLYYHGLFYIPFKISILTKRLKKNILKYSVSTWGINVLSASLMFIETFSIAALIGLGSAAIYSIAKLIISPIIIPSSSAQSISIPLISDAWRRRDLAKIEEIYKKTALILIVVCGFAFLLILANVTDILNLIPQRFYGSEGAITEAKWAIFILGAARIVDVSTSVNSFILQNSRKYYWIDFWINVVSVVISLPLNFFLIKSYGIIGAAMASFALLFMTNSIKTSFLYHSEKMHPFSIKWLSVLLLFVISGTSTFLINLLINRYMIQLPQLSVIRLILLLSLRSAILVAVFIPLLYSLHISADINSTINSILLRIKKLINR